MPVFWWVELSVFPLMSRAILGGVFWGVCKLSMTLDIMCAHGWVCVPLLFIVWCEVSSTGSCWHLGRAGSWIQIEVSNRALGD